MDDWKFDTARDHGMPALERYRSLSREGGLIETTLRMGWWSSVRLSLAVFHRIAFHGREHLPKEPPFVIVANHQSHLDALVVGAGVPLRMRDQLFPLAAGDLFFETPPMAAFSALALNALPVWRKNCGKHGLEELRDRLIRERCVYILFPEGTRTRSGVMGTFRSGVGMMVAGAPIPVVPCFIDGAYRAFPPQRRLPRPTKISVTFAEPLDFSEVESRRAGWDQVARETEDAVRCLAEASE